MMGIPPSGSGSPPPGEYAVLPSGLGCVVGTFAWASPISVNARTTPKTTINIALFLSTFVASFLLAWSLLKVAYCT